MTVIRKSLKQFRFTFTSRLQNLSLDAIEFLYHANDTFVKVGDRTALNTCLEYQRKAITDLKLLGYIALILGQGTICNSAFI